MYINKKNGYSSEQPFFVVNIKTSLILVFELVRCGRIILIRISLL